MILNCYIRTSVICLFLVLISSEEHLCTVHFVFIERNGHIASCTFKTHLLFENFGKCFDYLNTSVYIIQMCTAEVTITRTDSNNLHSISLTPVQLYLRDADKTMMFGHPRFIRLQTCSWRRDFHKREISRVVKYVLSMRRVYRKSIAGHRKVFSLFYIASCVVTLSDFKRVFFFSARRAVIVLAELWT